MSRAEFQGNIYTGDTTSLASLNKTFWAKLSAFDGVKYYTWTQQTFNTSGSFVDMPGGRFGSPTNAPAIEANGAVISPLPFFVKLERAYYDKTVGWVYIIVGAESPAGFTGTEQQCLGDGQLHTFTYQNGRLISVV